MYVLTIIRLDALTKVFENTELMPTILSHSSLISKINEYPVCSESSDQIVWMTIGDRICINVESHVANKLWFLYISKIS
jgi:hypothetical protein